MVCNLFLNHRLPFDKWVIITIIDYGIYRESGHYYKSSPFLWGLVLCCLRLIVHYIYQGREGRFFLNIILHLPREIRQPIPYYVMQIPSFLCMYTLGESVP